MFAAVEGTAGRLVTVDGDHVVIVVLKCYEISFYKIIEDIYIITITFGRELTAVLRTLSSE